MKNVQIVFDTEAEVQGTDVLTWKDIVPLLLSEASSEDRCPIFTF